ncbi:MAG: ABC transporter permease subunit [Rhodococcus sp. (in: high G+C Gram-positive bacteria)]
MVSVALVAVLGIALFGRYLTDLDPLATVARPWTPPNDLFPLGTDGLGRDVMARILWGGATLTTVALFAAAMSTVVGVAAGVWAGWSRRSVGLGVNAGADLLLAVPAILVGLVLAVALPMPVAVTAATVVAGAPLTARVVADVSAAARHATYIDVARMRGDPLPSILLHEVLPSHTAVITTDYGLRVIVALQMVSTINALGLGTPPPQADWASMITENYSGIALNAAATVAPAVALAVLATVIAVASTTLSGTLGGRSNPI